MSRQTVEERLAKLEDQMQQVLGVMNPTLDALEPAPDEWKLTAGIFDEADGMDEVFAEAMKLREAERREFRQKAAKQTAARRQKVS